MKPQELFDARDRGEKIEMSVGLDVWVEWDGTTWAIGWKFRIAPKPKKVVVKYQVLIHNDVIPNGLFATEEDGRAYWGSQFLRLLTDRPIECEVQDE